MPDDNTYIKNSWEHLPFYDILSCYELINRERRRYAESVKQTSLDWCSTMACTCLLNVRINRCCWFWTFIVVHLKKEKKRQGRIPQRRVLTLLDSWKLQSLPLKSTGPIAAKRKGLKMTNNDRSRNGKRERERRELREGSLKPFVREQWVWNTLGSISKSWLPFWLKFEH